MTLRQKPRSRGDRAAPLVADLPKHFEWRGKDFCHHTNSGDAVRVALASSYECPSDLHPLEFWELVRSATRRLFPDGRFDTPAFETALNTEIIEFRQKAPTGYVAWSRINFDPAKTSRIRFMGHNLTLYPNLPAKFSRAWRDPREFDSNVPPAPKGGVVAARGLFRSEDAAGYALSEVLDQFVAFLNFWRNPPSGFTYPEAARAVFRLGPTIGLYSEQTRGYGMGLWTNPNFDESWWDRGSGRKAGFTVGLQELRTFQRNAGRNPFVEIALCCMSLLNSAWMSREDDRWIMLVWACFEKIFSTGADGTRGAHAAVARRAAKFDANSETREAILQVLSEYRNDAAHSNGRPGQAHVARDLVSECSQFLVWIVRWLLREGHRFASKMEFLDWVDIPRERERLLYRRKLHNLALALWHPPEKRGEKA